MICSKMIGMLRFFFFNGHRPHFGRPKSLGFLGILSPWIPSWKWVFQMEDLMRQSMRFSRIFPEFSQHLQTKPKKQLPPGCLKIIPSENAWLRLKFLDHPSEMSLVSIKINISQMLHVWNIYLHLPQYSPKCR